MGSKEHSIIFDLIDKAPERNERLFRANVGMGWCGKVVLKGRNFVKLENPRPFHGLPEGFSDIFGLQTIEITQEMVGKKFALFVAYEVKTGSIHLSEEQELFGKMVEGMGGRWEEIRR